MKSVVKISDVYAEYIMEWFYFSVIDSCGDGAAIICCGNPSETADFFMKWWTEKYKSRNFFHPKDEYNGIINFHDNNENFMFSDREIELDFGDISFIIEKDCKSAKEDFIILGLK